MSQIEKILESMRNTPVDIRFKDLVKICYHYFGRPRVKGSHYFFTVPWDGCPLVNIQETKGRAKAYQVKQVLAAIARLEGEDYV